MTQSLLLAHAEVTSRNPRSQPKVPWSVLFWVAAGLTCIGLVDAALLWVPFRVAELAWRVDVVRATVDSLPLPTLGLAFMLMIGASQERNRLLTVVATLAAVVFTVLLVLLALFLASAVQFRASGGEAQLSQIAMGRTAFFAIVYLAIYATICAAAAQRVIAERSTR